MTALRLTSQRGFWLVATTIVVLLAASSAPSPLYPVYQARFGFSALTLTAIFAVYVVALLASLLVLGRLSDHVGRRPVLAAALLVEMAAMAVFLGATGVAWLVAARIVQGVATGAAIGVLGAFLLDLQPADGSRLGSLVNSAAPATGLGVGAIGTGLLVQDAPHPTRLVFVVLLALFAVLLVATLVLPEPVTRAPGALAALRPAVAVPPAARRAFAAASPVMFATWALGGLILSVGGSLVGAVFDEPNEVVVGLVLGSFALAGAMASVLVSALEPHAIRTIGAGALVAGTVLFLVALATTSFPVFVVAAVVAGGGFGAGFLGALRAVTQLARPHERAALLSAVFVVSYLAFSIPAVVAGVLITHVGLRETAVGYAALVTVLSVVSFGLSLVATLAARREETGSTGSHPGELAGVEVAAGAPVE